MPTTCDTKTNLADDIKNQNEVHEEHLSNFKDKVYVTPSKMEKLNNYLESKFGSDYVKSKEFDKAVKELFGSKDEQTMLALKINAIADGNRIYWDWIQKYIYTNLAENFKPKWRAGNIALDELPVSTLKNIYRSIAAWSYAGNGEWWGKGIVGKFAIQVGLPSTLALKESTGAYYIFQESAKQYAAKLSARINDFQMKPTYRKSKLNYGWNNLSEEIHSLIQYFPESFLKEHGTMKAERLIMRFFIFSTYGDAKDKTIIRFNSKINDYEIADNYMPTGTFYDKAKTEPIHGFTAYVPLKEFEGGKYYVPIMKMSPAGRKKFQDKIASVQKRFRKLDNELFAYSKKEFKKSVDAIKKAYENVFGFTDAELNFALTGYHFPGMLPEERKSIESAVNKKIGEKADIFEQLQQVITGTAVLNPYWGEENDEMKKNHFPAVYNQYKLPFIFESINGQLAKSIEKLESNYAAALQDNNIVEAKKIKKMMKNKRSQYARNERLIDDMSEVTMDFASDGQEIPVILNQKYMKKMSNSINPMNMRTDSHAYYASLKTQMSAIERNNLIAVMINQIGRADSNEVRDMIINNFKVPFAFTDVKSGLGPLDFSTENISHKFGKDSKGNYRVKPQVAAEWMRMLGAAISGQYLHGVGTAIQNVSALQQAGWDYGMSRVKDALSEYRGDRGTEWREFIQRSGVLEFRDFFSKSLTNDVIDSEIELDTHQQIIGAILKYYGYKKKWGVFGKYKKKKAIQSEEQLRKDIEKILLNSESYLRVSDIYLPTEERALGRAKLYKRKKLKGHIQKYVHWAINREIEFSPVVKEITAKNMLPKLIKGTFGEAFKNVSELVKDNPLFSMSAGEEMIRTVSFIIGVKRAKELGLLEDIPLSEYKGRQLEQAIEIGRLYSYNSNFGLTPQDVGAMWWSEGGNLVGKFKIWSMQKMSKDINSIKKGLISLIDTKDLIKNVEDPKNRIQMKNWFKAMGRFLKHIADRPKTLRTANHELAQMRDFVVVQGLITVLMDVLFFGPISAPGVRFVANRFGLRTVGGMRSDLLGLLLFLPVTLPLRLALADDEDDEVRWSFMFLMKHSMLGFLPSKGIDMSWSFINAIATMDEGEIRETIYKTLDMITPYRGISGARDMVRWGVTGEAPPRY